MPFRADREKEYYAILGLKEDASPKEIRKAYRKLALHHHPDRNRGDSGAEERFKAISEAYGVLMDPAKRQMYDLSRRAGVGASSGHHTEPGTYSSQEDILRDLIHNRDASAFFESQKRARCPRCTKMYPHGTTVCRTCHVALELPGSEREGPPAILIFETWDRPSADIVAGLLKTNGVTCLLRGTGDATHFGIGPQGFWRVYVQAADEARAQEILDAEIGREEAE